jgi:hypothetical protein
MSWGASGRRAWIAVALVIGVAAANGCGKDTADDDAGSGDDAGISSAFVADPPAVYVAKVKNILIGLPPTEAELAQVTADPDALGGLIDGWMKRPEYQQKMMVFFELAFQQTQITAIDFLALIPTNGLGVGRGIAPLLQNMKESFARTVLAMAAQGRPLTDAFTTRQLMMTPALMELYAFLDARPVVDTGKVIDAFARTNPGLKIVMQTAQGPIALADSLNPASPRYMHWYSPDVAPSPYPDPACNGLDPISFNASAQALHELLYGEVPDHPLASGANCGHQSGTQAGVQLAPSDFTAWKLVSIRQPAAGEPHTLFYDLPALRAATELVIATPRVGFFSTPAFFANWQTNASNQMRVTVNQALIVATGTAVDGMDPTSPPSTPGLDAAHAAPDTVCFGCHQQLDPTRSILSSTYSWSYYPQTDPALIRQPGLFAFQGVIAPMRTIDDFAQLLATHPLVAQAWGQKLCYYASSAPCNPIDPEFLRILAAFQMSGGSWNTLVRELMASPITTNVRATATATTNGTVVAVSRRDHMCAALNYRLGFVDICQLAQNTPGIEMSAIAQITSGMPSDGYSRGAPVPVLPNQPTLFYRAGAEGVCAAVSELVIDATPDPAQPGARRWSSAAPDAAIAAFVATMMALSPLDRRAAPATAILRAHFRAAIAAGATPRTALQSTFITACLSPSFLGIGM